MTKNIHSQYMNNSLALFQHLSPVNWEHIFVIWPQKANPHYSVGFIDYSYRAMSL